MSFRSALLLVLSLAAACGPDSGSAATRSWSRPADLDPQLAALVDAQLAQIRAHPVDAAAVGRLGVIYEANREWTQAREAFDAAFVLAPKEPLYVLHAALARKNLGDSDSAQASLQACAERFAACAPLQFALGEMLLDSGDLERASIAFDRTIAAAPKEPEGYAGRGIVELRQGHEQKASELLTKALDLDPRYRQAWYPLGLVLRAQGREQEAVQALERGREAPPRRMRDALNAENASLAVTRDEVLARAAVLVESGRAPEAIVKLEALARSRPDDALIVLNLGSAHLSAGHAPEAVTALERARSLDATLQALDLNLAIAYLSLDRKDEAAGAIGRALEREASNSRVHLVHAAVREAVGDAQGAMSARTRAVELDPRNPTARAELGRSLAQARNWVGAEEQFRAQTVLAPQDWRAHSNLARVVFSQGRRDDAHTALEAARRAAGSDSQAQQELSQLAAQMEKP